MIEESYQPYRDGVDLIDYSAQADVETGTTWRRPERKR